MMRLNMSPLSAAFVPGCLERARALPNVGTATHLLPGTPKAHRVAEHGKGLTSMISVLRD